MAVSWRFHDISVSVRWYFRDCFVMFPWLLCNVSVTFPCLFRDISVAISWRFWAIVLTIPDVYAIFRNIPRMPDVISTFMILFHILWHFHDIPRMLSGVFGAISATVRWYFRDISTAVPWWFCDISVFSMTFPSFAWRFSHSSTTFLWRCSHGVRFTGVSQSSGHYASTRAEGGNRIGREPGTLAKSRSPPRGCRSGGEEKERSEGKNKRKRNSDGREAREPELSRAGAWTVT